MTPRLVKFAMYFVCGTVVSILAVYSGITTSNPAGHIIFCTVLWKMKINETGWPISLSSPFYRRNGGPLFCWRTNSFRRRRRADGAALAGWNVRPGWAVQRRADNATASVVPAAAVVPRRRRRHAVVVVSFRLLSHLWVNLYYIYIDYIKNY